MGLTGIFFSFREKRTVTVSVFIHECTEILLIYDVGVIQKVQKVIFFGEKRMCCCFNSYEEKTYQVIQTRGTNRWHGFKMFAVANFVATRKQKNIQWINNRDCFLGWQTVVIDSSHSQ